MMNFIMLSCKKATLLIEKRSIFPLSVKEKIQLKVHTSMCDACSAYIKQSKTIDNALAKWVTENNEKKESLPEETKEKIIREIKEY